MYKASKDQVSVFGFRTHYGGGKSTGFALVYDSTEALKKFEPHYRLVRIGQATKIEKASRQQRMFWHQTPYRSCGRDWRRQLISLRFLQVNNVKIVPKLYGERLRQREQPRKRRNERYTPVLWMFGLVRKPLAVSKPLCNVMAYHGVMEQCSHQELLICPSPLNLLLPKHFLSTVNITTSISGSYPHLRPCTMQYITD